MNSDRAETVKTSLLSLEREGSVRNLMAMLATAG